VLKSASFAFQQPSAKENCMSISAIGSSGFTSASYGLGQMNSSQNSGPDSDEIAASIVEQDDADGDGLLSLEETPLDEDRFSTIDADGDGFISAEELSADAQSNMEQQGLMGLTTLQMQGFNTDDMAASIVSNDDSDGDGVLSQDETPLDDDTFSSIDANGDGFISADELSADMASNMSDTLSASGSSDHAASASGSGGSSESSSESEEEYDALDLNEDGTVSYDELLQAMQTGNQDAAAQLKGMGGNNGISALTQQYAMAAYQTQMGML